jgi:hypothetical protein
MTVLAWVLWATLETQSVPATGAPFVQRAVMERHESYQACDTAARWAEAQPALREEWTVTNGRKYRTVVTYACRQGRP